MDASTPLINEGALQTPNRQLERHWPSAAAAPNACIYDQPFPWYYQTPMLNTVFMDPNYIECHVETFVGMIPRFCAAEMIADTSKRSFTLLPIPADRRQVISEYCKIEYWESYMYNTKRMSILWKDLHEGLTLRREHARTDSLISALLPICPAPYSITHHNDTFYYRRHSSLGQHSPGNFHGYEDLVCSFRDHTQSFKDRPFPIPTRRSLENTGVEFAFVVVSLAIILIAAYLQKHIRSWSDDLDHPWLHWVEHKSA